MKWYQSTVASIEQGDRQVGLTEALRVAALFDVPPAQMWSSADGDDLAGLYERAAQLDEDLARAREILDTAFQRKLMAETEVERARADVDALAEALREVRVQIDREEGYSSPEVMAGRKTQRERITLHGYSTDEVDRYVAHAELELDAMAFERDQAAAQAVDLAAKVDRLAQELAEIRTQTSKEGEIDDN